GIPPLSDDHTSPYPPLPGLKELDCDHAGFEWIITSDADHSIFAWMRKGNDSRARCLVVANFTPQVHHDYEVRVPFFGRWREVLNTDSAHYGGSNVGNSGLTETLSGVVPKLKLTIPPLAVIFLVPEPA